MFVNYKEIKNWEICCTLKVFYSLILLRFSQNDLLNDLERCNMNAYWWPQTNAIIFGPAMTFKSCIEVDENFSK